MGGKTQRKIQILRMQQACQLNNASYKAYDSVLAWEQKLRDNFLYVSPSNYKLSKLSIVHDI